MTAFYPLVPSKAVEMIEAAGIPHAQRLIRDYAAAGLLKSYAKLIEKIEVGGGATCVRDGIIPTNLWRRIVREGVDNDVWTGGTVRLAAGEPIGGAAEVEITGIGFNGTDLQRLIDQHCGSVGRPKRGSKTAAPEMVSVEQGSAPFTPRRRPVPDLSMLRSGALLLSVNEAKAALGIGHTKAYELMNAGRLERREIDGGVRVTAASVRALAGIAD